MKKRATFNGVWQYEYSLKDHLGNTRVIFTDNDNNGEPEIIQEADYYPFGMRHDRSVTATNHYLYNGKELNTDLGLDWYDYGARWLDTETGRWSSLDPLAEYFPHESPYLYAGNNPIHFIDIDGLYKYAPENEILYSQRYPKTTRYLRTQIQKDVLKSDIILNAFYKHSEGNLTKDKVTEATTWGKGPTIVFSGGGQMGLYNEVGEIIYINSSVADMLEFAIDENVEAALFNLFTLILHETTHYGDYLDGGRVDGRIEPGNDFFQDVYAGRYIEGDIFIIDGYNLGSCLSNCDTGNPSENWKVDDYNSLNEAKKMIQKQINENKHEVLPTVLKGF